MKKDNVEKTLKLEIDGYAAEVITEACIKHLYESVYELTQYAGFKRMDDESKESVFDVVESLRIVLYYLMSKPEAMRYLDEVQKEYE